MRESESIQYRTLSDGTSQKLVSKTEYDDNGRVIRSVNAEGVETLNTYNSMGKRETVTTPSGTTRYEYDIRGNLSRAVYPDETFTEAFFDAEGRRIRSIDRDGNETRYEYDALGRLTKTLLPGHTEEDPVAVASDYDELGRVIARYDERNLQAGDRLKTPLTRYIYDSTPHELPIEETVKDRLDHATHYEYDRNGNLLRVTDARNKTTEYEYDGNGQRTKTIFHDDTFIKTEYDKAGQRKAEIDQAGVRTEFDYDDAGRLKQVLDAKGGLTEYTYDEVGNMLTQKDAEGRVTSMEYDKIGRLTKRTLPDIDFDPPAPTLSEAFEYDESGNTAKHIALTEDVDDPPEDRITTFKYDTNNRLRQKHLPYSHFSASMNNGGPIGAFCSFLVTASEDGASSQAILNCQHDLSGTYTLSIKEDTGSGLATIIEYVDRAESPFTGIWTSPLDHLQAVHSGNLYLVFEQGGTEVMRGRIIGSSPIVEYDYTNNGQRTRAGADAYQYDLRGRLTRETKANGQIIGYGYDKAGNRTSVTIYAEDGIEITTEAHYSYDALNRIDHVWDGPKGDNRRTDYTYDEVGNLATVHYPNNTNTTYTYDDLNRLISVKQVTMADPVDRIIEYVYTLGPTGNREQVEEYQYHSSMENPYENGPYRKVKYKYDKLYRLTGEKVLDYTGSIERAVTYEYDKVGNRLSMKVANADGHLEVTYTYNERDQLTTETRVFDQISEVTFKPDGSYYGYAPPTPSVWSGRLLLSFASLTLTCLLAPFVLLKTNSAGKRARRNRCFVAAISAFMTPMFVITPDALAYLHNDAMWYSAVASGAVGLPGPTTTTVTYTYDNSGNLISKEEDNGLATSAINYTYDAENHLIQVDPNNGPHTIISYTYDADGIRLSKTKAGETTYYTTDKNRPYAQVLEERNQDGNLLIQYAYGHDLISQTTKLGDPEESIRYYHYDGQMSTRLITDGTENTAFTGWITDEITYDAFGQITDRQDYGNPTNTKYLYTGEQYDNDLGQYYLRARYYDQAIGRFTARDTFEGSRFEPHSLHRYLYANSNPVNGYDPSGKFTITGMLVSAGISGLLAASLITAYGCAKEWTAGEIAKAAGYAFLLGAVGGILLYGAAWSLAAGALATGVSAGQAAALAWTAVGLMTAPMGIGLASANYRNAREHGDSVDQGFAIVGLGLAAIGFLTAHWAAFSTSVGMTATQIPQVTQNRINGDAAEISLMGNLEANGFSIAGRKVKVNTPLGVREIDIVVNKPGKPGNYGIEVKSSRGAFTRNDARARHQSACDRWINQNGAVGTGRYSNLRIAGTCKVLWEPN